jgi:carbon-monoxide dehydrogenase small subunit
MDIRMTINGFDTQVEARPYENLRDLLRRIGYRSVKKGCDVGGCGTCTVLVDRRAVYSCCVLAGWAQGKNVETVEGLSSLEGNLDPIQESFILTGAAQCGYCTSGFLMVSKEIIAEKPNATEEEVRKALSGNLCRCTGYVKIVDAIMMAKKKQSQQQGPASVPPHISR